MANIVHPLLTLLASLTRQELAEQIRYLKAENEILRSKLPGRVTLDNRERNTLVKHGKKAGREDQGCDDDRVVFGVPALGSEDGGRRARRDEEVGEARDWATED